MPRTIGKRTLSLLPCLGEVYYVQVTWSLDRGRETDLTLVKSVNAAIMSPKAQCLHSLIAAHALNALFFTGVR